MTLGGCYHLVIRVPRAVEIGIGRLGRRRLPAGWYVYTGSARSGLRARIARHLRRRKTLHWHIDYLLAAPGARVVEVIERPGVHVGECSLNQAIGRLGGARAVVPGFGASDCRAGCPAHVYYFCSRPVVPAAESHVEPHRRTR